MIVVWTQLCSTILHCLRHHSLLSELIQAASMLEMWSFLQWSQGMFPPHLTSWIRTSQPQSSWLQLCPKGKEERMKGCVWGIRDYLLSFTRWYFPNVWYSYVGGHTGISLRPVLFGSSHISVLTCIVPGTGGGLSPTWVHKRFLLSAIEIQ